MCDYLGCPAAAGLRPDHLGAVRSQYLYQMLYELNHEPTVVSVCHAGVINFQQRFNGLFIYYLHQNFIYLSSCDGNECNIS